MTPSEALQALRLAGRPSPLFSERAEAEKQALQVLAQAAVEWDAARVAYESAPPAKWWRRSAVVDEVNRSSAYVLACASEYARTQAQPHG